MLSKDLNQPFPYEAYRANYEGKVYVGVNWIVERLNEVIGAENWHHEFYDVNENMDDFSIEVLGKLSIYVDHRQEWISRLQYGNDTMTINKGETLPKPQARMDCKKSAVSDSLKKTAGLFGAAADIYKNVIDVITDKRTEYLPLIRKFNLNEYQYKNGIPVLPDSYKEFYVQHEWNGIFYSDYLEARGNRSRNADAFKDNSPEDAKRSRANNQNKGSQNNSNSEASTSTAPATQTGNGPHAFRMKVLAKPVYNPDQSATFLVMLEDSTQVTCFANKQAAANVKNLKDGDIVHLFGWYKESAKKINIAAGQAITVEKAA